MHIHSTGLEKSMFVHIYQLITVYSEAVYWNGPTRMGDVLWMILCITLYMATKVVKQINIFNINTDL